MKMYVHYNYAGSLMIYRLHWESPIEMKECEAYSVTRINTHAGERSSASQQHKESKMPASGNSDTSYTYVSAPKCDITRDNEKAYKSTSESGVTGGDTGDEKHMYDVIPTRSDPEHEYDEPVTRAAQQKPNEINS